VARTSIIPTSRSLLRLPSSDLTMVVPTSVSNAPLPDHVYSLPPNMQAQPSLTRFWCESYLVSLTTASSKDPDGTVHGLTRSMQVPGYCSRKTNFGICSGCAAAKKGSCVEVGSLMSLCLSCSVPLLIRSCRSAPSSAARLTSSTISSSVPSARPTSRPSLLVTVSIQPTCFSSRPLTRPRRTPLSMLRT
jgi:hypothetical protein